MVLYVAAQRQRRLRSPACLQALSVHPPSLLVWGGRPLTRDVEGFSRSPARRHNSPPGSAAMFAMFSPPLMCHDISSFSSPDSKSPLCFPESDATQGHDFLRAPSPPPHLVQVQAPKFRLLDFLGVQSQALHHLGFALLALLEVASDIDVQLPIVQQLRRSNIIRVPLF
jgi:hypothetical protein